MSKYCKNCGAQLKAEVKFCASCGAEVSMPSGQTAAAAAPHITDGHSAFAPKRKTPLKKILIPAIAVVLVIVVGIGVLPRFLGGGKYSFEQGATVEASIQADKDATVGSLKETGWQLDIPANTFEEDCKLNMRVLSEAESAAYKSADFALYGTPVEIKLENRENVRLGGAVSVTLQIPKDLLKDLAAEDLFFAVYYDGGWEYFSPDNVNMEKGTATVEVYHFSFFGFGKPSEEKQIKTYAKNYAALQWESEKHTKKLTDSLSRQYDDLFASIGVNDSLLRTQLTLDVINYLESEKLDTGDMSPISTLANMANAVSQGQAGMDDFRGQLIEFTGRALYRTLEKDPGKFASLANVTGGLSTAAGAISAGDTEGALQGIASMLRGADPIVAVVDTALTCVKESMEYGIELWTQDEIEKAYQVYIGNAAGKYGYESGLEGDFDAIFTTLGGGERMMKINIVKKYCAKYGIKESELSQSDRDRIVSNAMTYLKRTFDERKVSDAGIAKLQQSEEAFIAELKKQNLLGASSYQKYFGIDKNLSNFNIGDRLARLYKLKATVLGVMDKDAAAKISDEELAKAINQWIYWNEKGDRAGFFRYMREMGYIKEPYEVSLAIKETKAPEQTASAEEEKPAPSDPVALDPDSDIVPVASSGSFVCSTWINTSMDSFAVGGGTLTSADWGYSRGYRGYNLSGTCKAGETVSLSISGTMGEMGYQMTHKGNNLIMTLKVFDISGKEISQSTQKIEILKSGSKSLADVVSIAVPANASRVEMLGSFTCNWVTPHSAASEMVAISVKLKVVK